MKILDQGVKPQETIVTKELCDVNPVNNTSVKFIRIYTLSEAGAVLSTADVDLITGAPYVVTGNVEPCETVDIEKEALCEEIAPGNNIAFYRVTVYDSVTGDFVKTYDIDENGVLYTVTNAQKVFRRAEKKQMFEQKGVQSIAVTDAAAVSLTVPVGAEYATIQVVDANIAFTADGATAPLNDGTVGKQLFKCGQLELGCNPELFGDVADMTNLRAIALAGTTGRLEVCYYGKA